MRGASALDAPRTRPKKEIKTAAEACELPNYSCESAVSVSGGLGSSDGSGGTVGECKEREKNVYRQRGGFPELRVWWSQASAC